MHEGKHSERCAANNDLFVPENPRLKCISPTYTANVYRQTTDKLMFKSVISTVR